MNLFLNKNLFLHNILKGIGQIMLQENSLTGLLFLVGIFIGNWICGLAILVATIIGTLTAILLEYNKNEINAGLYGFSAALVGIALTYLFQATLLIWVLIVLGSTLATVMQHFFMIKKIPVFTLPFIVITWISVYFLHHYTNIQASDTLSETFVDSDFSDVFTAISGFGEVIFQGSVISAVIFFLAVFFNSPIAALYGLAASLLGAYISHLDEQPLMHIHMGLFGFNAILSAIVFSGTKKIDGLWVLVAVVLTATIDDLLIDSGWLKPIGGVFTFPFVLGTWLTFLTQNLIYKLFFNNEKSYFTKLNANCLIFRSARKQ